MINDDIRNELLRGIENCALKTEYHMQNSLNSRLMNNIIGTTNTILSALTALSMTVLTVMSAPAYVVAIVGAGFAFVITASNKIKDDMSFLALNYQHLHAYDQYCELENDYNSLLVRYNNRDLEGREFKREYLDALNMKYISIVQQSHLQDVCNCSGIYCCFK